MALPGELAGTQGTKCSGCGAGLELEVLQSAAGYYLGYFCFACGPYSRETTYFPDYETAKRELLFIQSGGTSIYIRQ